MGDSSKMARLMFLVLVLPIAMVEMSTLRGVDLKVTTVTHRPFITPNNLSSGDRYQGLLVDMLRELSNMLGFTFTIHDNADFTHPFLYIGLGVIGYRGSAPRSLQQLADDHSVKIGAFCCGSTAAAFANSTDPLYQKIWARMQEDPENMMTNSNEDGVDKVLANRGGYVYIMESVSVDYEVARNCRLTEVGKRFMPRSYALALAQGSPPQRGAEQGHLEVAGVWQDGDARQEVDRTRGVRVCRRAGGDPQLALWHLLVVECRKYWLKHGVSDSQQTVILNWLSSIF